MHIAILSLSVWALVVTVPALAPADDPVQHLPRRTTAAFLATAAALFATLWLSEIAESIVSGGLPPAVAALGLPDERRLCARPGVRASDLRDRGDPPAPAIASGAPLALGSLVVLVLMALSILPIFAIEATRGALSDPVPVIVFAAIVVVSAVLAGAGLMARPTAEQRDSAPPLAAPPSLSGF